MARQRIGATKTATIPGIPPTIAKTLSWMELAEEAIASGGNPPGAFALLRPSRVLLDYGASTLYRHHAVELVMRVAMGLDTRPATNAELLAAMMMTALKSPLTQCGAAMTTRLFTLVMGEEAGAKYGLDAKEQWPGQVDQEIDAARRQFSQNDRR